jgi:hypothetical protein
MLSGKVRLDVAAMGIEPTPRRAWASEGTPAAEVDQFLEVSPCGLT